LEYGFAGLLRGRPRPPGSMRVVTPVRLPGVRWAVGGWAKRVECGLQPVRFRSRFDEPSLDSVEEIIVCHVRPEA